MAGFPITPILNQKLDRVHRRRVIVALVIGRRARGARLVEVLAYDLDGNLTFNGTWTYEWDGEKRLRTMTMTNTVAGIGASNRLRLEFVYDYQGRRVQKIVSMISGSAIVAQGTNRFANDGWNHHLFSGQCIG